MNRVPPTGSFWRGWSFTGFTGPIQRSRALGQPYVVDLAVELDLRRPGGSDQLEDTVSYSLLYRTVKLVMEGESKNLLEATAQTIAERVLTEFPVKGVRVRVRSPVRPSAGRSSTTPQWKFTAAERDGEHIESLRFCPVSAGETIANYPRIARG